MGAEVVKCKSVFEDRLAPGEAVASVSKVKAWSSVQFCLVTLACDVVSTDLASTRPWV